MYRHVWYYGMCRSIRYASQQDLVLSYTHTHDVSIYCAICWCYHTHTHMMLVYIVQYVEAILQGQMMYVCMYVYRYVCM